VDGEVVHDYYPSGPEPRTEHFVEVEREGFSIRRPFDDHLDGPMPVKVIEEMRVTFFPQFLGALP
jgi:hypothetical protein